MKVELYPTTKYGELKHGECFLCNSEAYIKLKDSYDDSRTEDYEYAHFINCALRFRDSKLIEFSDSAIVQPIDLKVVKV